MKSTDRVPLRAGTRPVQFTDDSGTSVEIATVSHPERAPRRSCARLHVVRASVTLGALVAACGAATYFTRDHARLVESRAIEVRDLIHSLVDSGSTTPVRRIRVAIFRDESSCNAPEDLTRILESEMKWIWEFVSPSDTRAGMLKRYDVVVFPGGSGSRQGAVLGPEGKQAVRDFVFAGGGYVGICGGAFLATAGPQYLDIVHARAMNGERDIPGVGIVSMATRGPATVQMELSDVGKLVLGDFPGMIDVEFAGGPIFLDTTNRELPPIVPLAHYRSEVSNYEPQRGTMIHTPSIIAARFGDGRVIAMSPHPEITKGLDTLVKRAILAAARKPKNEMPVAGDVNALVEFPKALDRLAEGLAFEFNPTLSRKVRRPARERPEGLQDGPADSGLDRRASTALTALP